MKISVVMAAYNGEKYIKEQLESFCNQTVLPDELIVCDDCSIDSTYEILQDFKNNAPFNVILMKNEKNIGSTKSFEKACRLITGDWVFFSDQDDVWKENKIEEFVKVFESDISDLGLVFCDYDIVDANLNVIKHNYGLERIIDIDLLESDKAYIRLLQGNVIPGCVISVKREVIEKSLPFRNKWHDYWLMLCSSINHRIKIIRKSLIKYRQHPKQQLGCYMHGSILKTDKNFIQKYIYDYKKFERRKYSRIKNFIETYNGIECFIKYLTATESNKQTLLDLAIRFKYFYRMRLELATKPRLLRFVHLLKLYINGYYKKCISGNSFSEFRRDIVFPPINKGLINSLRVS